MSNQDRQQWMSILANTPVEELESAWDGLPGRPVYRILRGPETGLIMVQARAGGVGERFNLGEMTMTRCVLQTRSGLVGYSYLAGRDSRKAELAALFDALLQDPESGPGLYASVILPLARNQAARKAQVQAKTSATKVDFFTMVRGDE